MKYHNIKLWKIKRFQFSMTKWYYKKTHLLSFSPFEDNFIFSINHPLTNITLACAEPSLEYFQHLKLHAHVSVVLSPSSQCENVVFFFFGGGEHIYIYTYLYITQDRLALSSHLLPVADVCILFPDCDRACGGNSWRTTCRGRLDEPRNSTVWFKNMWLEAATLAA